jgi:hypothetical protein
MGCSNTVARPITHAPVMECCLDDPHIFLRVRSQLNTRLFRKCLGPCFNPSMGPQVWSSDQVFITDTGNGSLPLFIPVPVPASLSMAKELVCWQRSRSLASTLWPNADQSVWSALESQCPRTAHIWAPWLWHNQLWLRPTSL